MCGIHRAMSETEIWQSVYSYGRNSQGRKDALVSSRWRAIESGVSDSRGHQDVGIPTPGAPLQKFRVSAAFVLCQPHLVISDTTQFSWRDRFKHPRKRGDSKEGCKLRRVELLYAHISGRVEPVPAAPGFSPPFEGGQHRSAIYDRRVFRTGLVGELYCLANRTMSRSM